MDNVCEVILYTESGALSFMAKATCEEFAARVTEAFENGVVVLETIEGSQLIVSTLNVVAIEVKQVQSVDTPPG